MVPPHASVYLPRMAEKRPPLLIRSRQGYRLESKPRAALEEKYGRAPSTVYVSRILQELASKVATEEERRFLDETLRCYSVAAFRAAIVMAWNLAYDHLQRWILADKTRLDAFNASLAGKYPKKGFTVGAVDDLSELKEFEVVETCQHARLITKNTSELMKEKLKRRNAAAHPSSIVVTQHQADDVITDLVNNVMAKLN